MADFKIIATLECTGPKVTGRSHSFDTDGPIILDVVTNERTISLDVKKDGTFKLLSFKDGQGTTLFDSKGL